MSNESRREWCDDHGEEFPMPWDDVVDDGERTAFQCAECNEWLEFSERFDFEGDWVCESCKEKLE